MAKRLSKRVKTKTRVKISKKLRETYRNKRGAEKKHEKLLAGVPKSVIMLDSELEEIKRIREMAKETKPVELDSRPAHIRRLTESLETADLLIETVDSRDVFSGRSYECEKLVKEKGKKLYLYFTHKDKNPFIGVLTSIERECILESIESLSDVKEICIFGQASSGKFRLSEEIRRINTYCIIKRIRTPCEEKSIGGMLRGAISEESFDALLQFQKIWGKLDKESLMKHYILQPVSTCEEFLDAISLKNDGSMSTRKRRESSALRFFNDVKSGRIAWAVTRDGIVFGF